MLRYMLIIALVVTASSCGGGGGGGSKGGSPTPPPEVDTSKKFKLGGQVKGLRGNLAIANGDDTLSLSEDGTFMFVKPVSEGSLYNVKIVALPQNQLCELRNSKNFAYRDRYDLSIECAVLIERKAVMNIPARYKLSDLRVVSNYQAKGGSGEDPLVEASTTLTVFDNSVVTLRNAANQMLFMAYLTDTTAESFELNSKSTAMALILLEPTVVSAINYRKALLSDAALKHPSQVNAVNAAFTKLSASSLVSVINSKGDLDALTQEIQTLIDNGGNLATSTMSLSASLSRVLDSTVRTISAIQVPSAVATPLPTTVIKQKYSDVNSSTALGVAFTYSKAADNTGTLNLLVGNQHPRYVLLRAKPNHFADTLLDPYGAASFELKSGIVSKENFNVVISGPGTLGSFSAENEAGVIQATLASGIGLYFLPSVNAILGLKNPDSFNARDCVAAATIKNLDTTSASQVGFVSDLQNDKYYKLFTQISFVARDKFITGKNADNQSPISELFSCEKFGLGVLIGSKKAMAIENTSDVLNTLNNVYKQANFPATLNLFLLPQVSQLSEAIRNSYAERIWVLSTALQFSILANRTQTLNGQAVQFLSSCKDPATAAAVACDVEWNFGDGSKAIGGSTSHTYTQDGFYTVTAKAQDVDGAQQTQTVIIDVISVLPGETAYGGWTVTHGDSVQEFNSLKSSTIYDDTEAVMQIRLFATLNQENPQLRLLLNGYNFNSNTRGNGVYSLDDSTSGETCLGFYGGDEGPANKFYCTSTLGLAKNSPFTGTVTVTTDSATAGKKAVFQFTAYDKACTNELSTCDTIRVTGSVNFKPGL